MCPSRVVGQRLVNLPHTEPDRREQKSASLPCPEVAVMALDRLDSEARVLDTSGTKGVASDQRESEPEGRKS